MPIAPALPFISAAISAVGLIQGMSKKQEQPAAAAAPAPVIQPPTPAPEAQVAKAPTQQATKKVMQGMAGLDPTALTGPLGVGNDKLTLGKATVLGS